MVKNINEEIREVYKQYIKELTVNHNYLLDKSKFSNFFVTGVLDNWEEKPNKILIVGEEGAWKKSVNYQDEITACQDWVIKELYEQLYGKKDNKGSFWKRARKIAETFKNASFGYANIDAINSLESSNGALVYKDRKELHLTNTKLLNEVVKIIKPTLVIFFGWHNVSLKHEFEGLYDKIYPEKHGNTRHFRNEKRAIGNYFENGVNYLFTYHPSYAISRTKLYKNNEEYDFYIMQTIKKILGENNEN